MRNFLILAAISLALSGCLTTSTATVTTSPATVSPSQASLVTACNTYAVALSTAADFRAKMSVETQNAVDKIVSVVSPLCDASKPLPTDLTSTIDLVSASAAQLTNLVTTAKSN